MVLFNDFTVTVSTLRRTENQKIKYLAGSSAASIFFLNFSFRFNIAVPFPG